MRVEDKKIIEGIKKMSKIYGVVLLLPFLLLFNKGIGRMIIFFLWPISSLLYFIIYIIKVRRIEDNFERFIHFHSKNKLCAILFHMATLIVIVMCYMFIKVVLRRM